MQKLRKRWRTVRWRRYWRALRARVNWHVGDGNFRPSFYKKQYLSNGQTGCREISNKHCK